MDPRISIVTLGVDDLDHSREFYCDGLPERESDGDIAFYELSGTWLALYPWDDLAEDATVDPDGSGFRGVTISHNAESKDAVDVVMQEAEDAGATIVKEAQDAFWGGYSGYSSDSDGHLWEVAGNPNWKIEEPSK